MTVVNLGDNTILAKFSTVKHSALWLSSINANLDCHHETWTNFTLYQSSSRTVILHNSTCHCIINGCRFRLSILGLSWSSTIQILHHNFLTIVDLSISLKIASKCWLTILVWLSSPCPKYYLSHVLLLQRELTSCICTFGCLNTNFSAVDVQGNLLLGTWEKTCKGSLKPEFQWPSCMPKISVHTCTPFILFFISVQVLVQSGSSYHIELQTCSFKCIHLCLLRIAVYTVNYLWNLTLTSRIKPVPLSYNCLQQGNLYWAEFQIPQTQTV